MFKVLLILFRVALIAFLVLGLIITVGQFLAVLFGATGTLTSLGNTWTETAGIAASVCAVFSFACIYLPKRESNARWHEGEG